MSAFGPEAAVRCAASIRQQFGGIETNQNFPPAHSYLAAALAHLGQLDEAQAAVKTGLALDPAFTLSLASLPARRATIRPIWSNASV
jgi:hypothetical protein